MLRTDGDRMLDGDSGGADTIEPGLDMELARWAEKAGECIYSFYLLIKKSTN